MLVPGAMDALQATGAAIAVTELPQRTVDLVEIRVSQINGCSSCVDAGSRAAKQAGETDDRLFTVAAWRHAPHFSDAERAALALGEAETRLARLVLTLEPVQDEEARRGRATLPVDGVEVPRTRQAIPLVHACQADRRFRPFARRRFRIACPARDDMRARKPWRRFRRRTLGW